VQVSWDKKNCFVIVVGGGRDAAEGQRERKKKKRKKEEKKRREKKCLEFITKADRLAPHVHNLSVELRTCVTAETMSR
jgi:hypothetical protein